MGNRIPLQSKIKGIDTVTGQPATTGGPYASPNAVKPFGHPAAIEAQRRNKTGPYAITKQMPQKPTSSTPTPPAKPVSTVPPVKIPDSVGVKAAASAPVTTKPSAPIPPVPFTRQPQGMNKPTVAAHHVDTASKPPATITHDIENQETSHEEGNTSKDGENPSKDA